MNNNDIISALEILQEHKTTAKRSSFSKAEVVREGHKIILPDGMSTKDGIMHLKRLMASEESEIVINETIKCFPTDGALAMREAIEQECGFTFLKGQESFFGSRPPMTLKIPVSTTEKKEIVLDSISPPALEGGSIGWHAHVEDGLPVFVLSATVKKKFEKTVTTILNLTKDRIKYHSVYKGKAIRVSLEDITGEAGFDWSKHVPQFMDVQGIKEENIIFDDKIWFNIKANIMSRIQKPDAVRKNNASLKHGVLLAGPYGTGKTFVAKYIAKVCEDNGWTFIYSKDSSETSAMIKLAQVYQPAVVFVEDIDQVTSSGRTAVVNEIMNTLDGVDTKSQDIITIMTTNFHNSIEPGMVRPGRIDSIIYVGKPGPKAAERFVTTYSVNKGGEDLLAPSINLEEVGEALAGFVPAFISEAVQKAKLFSVFRNGEDIVGKVETEDLLLAAESMKDQVGLTERKVESRTVTQDEIGKRITDLISGGPF